MYDFFYIVVETMSYTGFPIITTNLAYAPNFQTLPVTGGGGGAWRLVGKTEVLTSGTDNVMSVSLSGFTPAVEKMYRLYWYFTLSVSGFVYFYFDAVQVGGVYSTGYCPSTGGYTGQCICSPWDGTYRTGGQGQSYQHSTSAVALTSNNAPVQASGGSAPSTVSIQLAAGFFGAGSRFLVYEALVPTP